MPVEIGWSDIGSSAAPTNMRARDEFGNASFGDVVVQDTHNCLNLIIVATPDAVLILPRGDSEQVKHAVERPKRDGHVTLDRPFGERRLRYLIEAEDSQRRTSLG